MTILGPPNFDAAPPTAPDAYHAYAGEPEIPLVETGDDNGSIAGSKFQGGSVQLAGGPWTVTGNAHLGAFAGSYTPSAFSLVTPHDVTFTSNLVIQTAAGGTTFRLVNLAESGYDDTIVGNTFVGGQVGNEVTYVKTSATSGFYSGINDSEVILTEPKDFLFEGTPAAISADGRTLVLPMASSTVASRTYVDGSTGPGLIVSIVDAANPLAGTYYRVAQQLSSSPLTFLMQDPLPAGKYVISVVAGFVGDTISDNVINLAGKSSTGIVLSGSDFGTTVASNTIQGGGTYSYPYTGTGILVESGVVSNRRERRGGAVPGRVRVVALPDARHQRREQLHLQLDRQPGRRGPPRPRHRRRRRPAVPDGDGHGQHVRLAAGVPLGLVRGVPGDHQRQRQPGEPGRRFAAAAGRDDRRRLLGQRRLADALDGGREFPARLRRPGRAGRGPRRERRLPRGGLGRARARRGGIGAGLRRPGQRRGVWRLSDHQGGRGPRGRPVALCAPERPQPRDRPGPGRPGGELHDGRDRRRRPRRRREPRRPRQHLFGLGVGSSLAWDGDVRPRGRQYQQCDLGRRPDDRAALGPLHLDCATRRIRSSARRRARSS